MARTYTFNTLTRGDDWTRTIQLDTDTLDFTGATYRCYIRKDWDAKTFKEITVTEISNTGTSAVIALSLTSEQTALLQCDMVGDVELTLTAPQVITALRFVLPIQLDATNG